MFDFLIGLIVVTNIGFYILGVRMDRKLYLSDVAVFKKYGSPRFYIYGIKEYRLLIFFILFGDYKRESLNQNCLRVVGEYKLIFTFNLILLIVFLMFLVLANK